jgi:hypothetical protein
MTTILAAGLGLALAVTATAAMAQPPAPAPLPANSLVSAAPTFTAVNLEIDVNRPAAEVWKRVGKFCDIGEWLRIAAGCTITSGQDGEVGAVRSVGSEILVGKTPFSYTYTQPVTLALRQNRPYNVYHGTLEARATGPKTTKLVYTLFFDDSMIPDKAANKANFTTRFGDALKNMKTLAEGGTLPPPAPPAPAPAR